MLRNARTGQVVATALRNWHPRGKGTVRFQPYIACIIQNILMQVASFLRLYHTAFQATKALQAESWCRRLEARMCMNSSLPAALCLGVSLIMVPNFVQARGVISARSSSTVLLCLHYSETSIQQAAYFCV
jgi:hypothetical protein